MKNILDFLRTHFLKVALGALVFIVCFHMLTSYIRHHPNTDDSYLNANLINLAAQVTGPVSEVFVNDHQVVQKNQRLFTIDPRPFLIARDQAAANLTKDQAILTLAQKNAKRTLALAAKGDAPQSDADHVTSNLHTAEAEVLAAQSALAKAELDLQYTQVVAPTDGILINFNLRPGTIVSAETPLFALIENNMWWVDANFKEVDVEHIRPGQSVDVHIDMYPGKTFQGKVDSVSSGSGAAFSLLPPENATGNWIKVIQRFPVKVILENPSSDTPLRIGASAKVTVNIP